MPMLWIFFLLGLGWAQQLRGTANYEQCGVLGQMRRDPKHPNSATTRIVHGRDAGQCVWRWQVSIGVQRGKSGPVSFCGGTLVAPGWVLTAAHCVEKMSVCKMRKLRVVAGDWKQFSDEEAVNGLSVERKVKKIYTHHLYEKAASSDYDFALLELDKDVPINECIGVACLPETPDQPGTDCQITGWGTLVSSGPTPSVLQEAPVTLVSNSHCQSDYARANETITSAMMCATGRSMGGITDTCQGDSGGPLVCEESNRYFLRGVTSWGDGCALRHFPGVYARVTSAVAWIREVMEGALPSDLQEPEVDFQGAMWKVVSGPCKMDEQDCITSPGFPKNYSAGEGCMIAVNTSAAEPLYVERFSTEEGYDALLVNCKAYSGLHSPEGVVPDSTIYWVSDASVVAKGWKICPSPPIWG